MTSNTKYEEVHVLVHPHFFTDVDGSFIGSENAQVIGVSKRAKELAQGHTFTEKLLERSEVNHRFYKKQIDQIGKDKNKFLVILTGLNTNDLAVLTNRLRDKGIPDSKISEVVSHVNVQQQRLVDYAKKKLKNRVLLHTAAPYELKTIGDKLKQKLSENNINANSTNFRVFGESIFFCVPEANDSLRRSGFNSLVDVSRCPYL